MELLLCWIFNILGKGLKQNSINRGWSKLAKVAVAGSRKRPHCPLWHHKRFWCPECSTYLLKNMKKTMGFPHFFGIYDNKKNLVMELCRILALYVDTTWLFYFLLQVHWVALYFTSPWAAIENVLTDTTGCEYPKCIFCLENRLLFKLRRSTDKQTGVAIRWAKQFGVRSPTSLQVKRREAALKQEEIMGWSEVTQRCDDRVIRDRKHRVNAVEEEGGTRHVRGSGGCVA